MKKPWSPWHTVLDFDSVNDAHKLAHPGFTLGLLSFSLKAIWALDRWKTLSAVAPAGPESVEENPLPHISPHDDKPDIC